MAAVTTAESPTPRHIGLLRGELPFAEVPSDLGLLPPSYSYLSSKLPASPPSPGALPKTERNPLPSPLLWLIPLEFRGIPTLAPAATLPAHPLPGSGNSACPSGAKGWGSHSSHRPGPREVRQESSGWQAQSRVGPTVSVCRFLSLRASVWKGDPERTDLTGCGRPGPIAAGEASGVMPGSGGGG